ncbi:MAG: hypothetical protein AB1847_13735 [bacterium]
MKNFQIEIGGIPVLIKSDESRFMQLIAEKYQAFASPCAQIPEKDSLTISPPAQAAFIQLYMDIRSKEKEEGKWDTLIEEKLWIDVSYHNNRFLIRRPDLEAEVNLNNMTARVTNRAAIYSFDSFLRILYSLILVQEGGFLLHAASVVRDGQGYVFMGKSGAGKSTLAAHCPEQSVLSDEISLVRKVESKYILYSTPFWGEQEIKGGNFCFPLKGIYQLKQSPRLHSRKLTARDALSRLMGNILYFSREQFLTRQLFQNCYDFIQHMTIYELEFQKNTSFWDVIDER